MLKKELLFFSAIILMGFLDWLTKVNPLLSGLTRSSMILFSAVKLSAVVLAGFAFYKAAAISRPTNNDWHFTKRFLDGGYSLTFLALIAVVANNMIAVFRL
jgi:hypothetical protein